MKDRQGEGVTLNNLGRVCKDLGRYEKATEYSEQALAIAREIKDRAGEAAALANLMSVYSQTGPPRLAVFYGKQSVNLYQTIRSEIRGLPRDIQKGYVESNAAAYRKLAELLGVEGRIAEAEQVLRLLKEEEYFEFVRRDPTVKPGESVAFNSREAAADARDRELSSAVTALGIRRAELVAKKSRSEQENLELEQVRIALETATTRYNAFLQDLKREFSHKDSGADRLKEIESASSIMGMWSLDGALRYLPIAALYDGEEYFIERYSNVVFSTRSRFDSGSANWNALALGVSKEHEVNGEEFSALPNVPEEMRAVVR